MKPISNKQYSRLDIMFNYFFILDLQESIYNKIKKTYYMSAGFAGRHVVDFEDLNIDIFLEVQDKKYS